MFDYRIIFNSIRSYLSVRDVLIVSSIIIVFFVVRLTNLEILPIFNDEGIYIEWAKIAKNDPAWRFISLTDGKQPLQTWLTILLLKLFPEHALYAGRFMSVLTGLGAMAGVITLLAYLFNKKTAYIGAVLYVIAPYFVFYDRMAMIDSGVNAAFIWILFFSILLVRTMRLDVALLFGIVGGIGLLSKSSVMMFLLLSACAPILVLYGDRKKRLFQIINYGILFSISFFLAYAIYNVQRLSPFFHIISDKNHTFIMSPSEFMAHPFMFVARNIRLIPYFIAAELGYVIAFLGVAGMIQLARKNLRLFIYISVWMGLPMIAIIFFNKVLFPRYIIFFASVVLMMAAYSIANLSTKTHVIGAWFAVAASVLFYLYAMLFNPVAIPFPQTDRGQYIEGWPAGWGVTEIIQYARDESTRSGKAVVILAEGNFGMAADVLRASTRPSDSNIAVDGRWPLNREDLIAAQDKLEDTVVLVVFSHRNEFPSDWPIELVREYKKPGDESSLYLHRLLAEPSE